MTALKTVTFGRPLNDLPESSSRHATPSASPSAPDPGTPQPATASSTSATTRSPRRPDMSQPVDLTHEARTIADWSYDLQLALGRGDHASAATAAATIAAAVVDILDILDPQWDTKTKGTVKVTVRTAARQAVDGHVPESLADQLRELWRHRVMLGGKVRRNARGQAIRIDVDAIERLPEGNEARPSTDALLGAATDWLDGLTVDEFLGRLRDYIAPEPRA